MRRPWGIGVGGAARWPCSVSHRRKIRSSIFEIDPPSAALASATLTSGSSLMLVGTG